MKYYKSFILFSLFALAFVSCNTDDLERDIDALKDRVTNVEAQVQQLNDEMNIIRVLLDGNKTITDYSTTEYPIRGAQHHAAHNRAKKKSSLKFHVTAHFNGTSFSK